MGGDIVVCDVCLVRDFSRIIIVDFGCFAPRSDALLFDWSELLAPNGGEARTPPLRLVRSEAEASQSRPRFAHNRVPRDVVDLSDGQTVTGFASAWQAALEEASAGTGSGPDVPDRPGR